MTKALLWLNIALAMSALTFGTWLFSIYLTPDPRDHHGGMFALFGAAMLLPISALFFLTAFAIRRNWKYKWLLQVLPLLIILFILAN